jgi:hypothetical protein
MVRPLDNQEHLRVNEYAGRVRKTKGSEKGGFREFSYEYHDAVEETGEKHPQEQERPEDTYEHSEEEKKQNKQEESKENPYKAKITSVPDKETGPLDIVV